MKRKAKDDQAKEDTVQTAFRRAEKHWRTHLTLSSLPRSLFLPPGAHALCSPAVAPGVVHLRGFLSPSEQLSLALFTLKECCGGANFGNVSVPGEFAPGELFSEWRTGGRRLERMRWFTLGRHYDWSARRYADHSAPFPPRLDALAQRACAAAGCPPIGVKQQHYKDHHALQHDKDHPYPLQHAADAAAEGDDPCRAADDPHQYAPDAVDAAADGALQYMRCEAGIVNLYLPKTQMCGHRDDAEPNALAPLVSVSLGLPALFLVADGREVEPAALLLRSGDALVLRGAARRAVHGVPRVLREPDPATGEGEEADCARYLNGHRINLNIRQVH